ncbi:MAG TPA: hypothetical protein VJT78_12655 [Candidatus Dormibacteraeota bacterium]|nr:hypothetical protein [Candidatus Dormibacteraeota bacterium]
MPAFRQIPRGLVEYLAPGDEAKDLQPGDFILTHGLGWQSSLIRFGQRVRLRGPNRRFAYWSHAAMIVGADGAIVEAEIGGVERNNLSRYRKVEYHLIRIGLSAEADDRRQAARFALECVGEPYDFLTVVSVAISLATGAKLSFGFDAHQICSGLVARALERTWAIFDREPSHIMPADLARHYAVEPRRASQPPTVPGTSSVLDQKTDQAADHDQGDAYAPQQRR